MSRKRKATMSDSPVSGVFVLAGKGQVSADVRRLSSVLKPQVR